MNSLGTNLIASLLSGVTLLPVVLLARGRSLPAAARPIFALFAAGILVSLIIELGYHTLEGIATPFKLGQSGVAFTNLALFALAVVLVGLAVGAYERRRGTRAAAGWPARDLALLTTVGLGLQNLGQGLAISHGSESGAAALGGLLVISGALRNALVGLAILGALRGERVGWGTLGLLGLIGVGPTLLGALAGTAGAGAPLAALSDALAAGLLFCAVREMLRVPYPLATGFSLATLTAGVLIAPLMMGPVLQHCLNAPPTGPVTVAASPRTVAVTIAGGAFSPAALEIPSGAALIVKNDDAQAYTLQGAGILRGDVPVEAGTTRTLQLSSEPGAYTINVEEEIRMRLPVKVSGLPPSPALEPDTVARALAVGRQPVLFPETRDPDYSAYTQFNLTVRGEEEREEVLEELFAIAHTVSSDWLPAELDQYFTRSAWVRLRPSVAMVIGLGPGCYDGARFGSDVAASRPAGLRAISYGAALGFDPAKSQKDLLVRVVSDSMWFNQQVCRYVWRRLSGRIAGMTLDSGYANPNGRSPLLGGFFDGTGNPIGEDRDKAVFLTGGEESGGTYLAWFRIRFDQERFEARPLADQQAIIGRVLASGRELPGDKAHSHRAKTEGDGSRAILRQGVVYDEGPRQTGLIFASLQASLTEQLEGILRGFMMNRSAPSAGTGPDQLLGYMHFEGGGYYYVPPMPKGED